MATLFRFIEPVISFLNAVVVLASLEVLSLVLFVRPRPLWAFREYLPAKRAAGCVATLCLRRFSNVTVDTGISFRTELRHEPE